MIFQRQIDTNLKKGGPTFFKFYTRMQSQFQPYMSHFDFTALFSFELLYSFEPLLWDIVLCSAEIPNKIPSPQI